MEEITWKDFERVELRIGTIVEVEDFPNARKPAYKLTIDFGELGIKKSSAQVAVNYSKADLIGKQILGVVNFPKKQIANFFSEVLVTGIQASDGSIVLVQAERPVPNGEKLC